MNAASVALFTAAWRSSSPRASSMPTSMFSVRGLSHRASTVTSKSLTRFNGTFLRISFLAASSAAMQICSTSSVVGFRTNSTAIEYAAILVLIAGGGLL